MNKEYVIQSFRTFKEDCIGSSPFYEHLVSEILDDEEMLAFSTNTREGQPAANMLLGAVHYILMRGVDHSLRFYYPSISDQPEPVEEMYPHFVDFCTIYRGELVSLMQSKIIQTNEVRRCAYLYPVFSSIYASEGRPLALVEIGTSSGVQLFVDSYAYDYGDGRIYGNKAGNVHIESALVGEPETELSFVLPEIGSRVGIDLHVNDVTNEDERLWLEALIWPEHKDRRELFEQATRRMDLEQVELVEGNGIEKLSDIVAHLPEDEVICVFHTHVANQFAEAGKLQLLTHIEEIGKKRPIYHIYNNMWDRLLHLDFVSPDAQSAHIVGKTESHGRWFTWEMKPVND